MPLKNQDLQYIAEKLGISLEKTEKLTEEDRDTNLVLNELSVKSIKKQDYSRLSTSTFIKLITFRYSYELNYSIEEKIYIANCIYLLYPTLKKEINLKIIDTDHISEKKSQYCIVLFGFFSDRLNSNIIDSNHIRNISEGFRAKTELRDLSFHVREWIDILREIHHKNWFMSL